MGLSMSQRHAVTKASATRYKRADKAGRQPGDLRGAGGDERGQRPGQLVQGGPQGVKVLRVRGLPRCRGLPHRLAQHLTRGRPRQRRPAGSYGGFSLTTLGAVLPVGAVSRAGSR